MVAQFGPDEVNVGDWIRFRSEYSSSGRLAEVHAVGIDAQSRSYAVTSEGRILFERILKLRRRPIAAFVMTSQ